MGLCINDPGPESPVPCLYPGDKDAYPGRLCRINQALCVCVCVCVCGRLLPHSYTMSGTQEALSSPLQPELIHTFNHVCSHILSPILKNPVVFMIPTHCMGRVHN